MPAPHAAEVALPGRGGTAGGAGVRAGHARGGMDRHSGVAATAAGKRGCCGLARGWEREEVHWLEFSVGKMNPVSRTDYFDSFSCYAIPKFFLISDCLNFRFLKIFERNLERTCMFCRTMQVSPQNNQYISLHKMSTQS